MSNNTTSGAGKSAMPANFMEQMMQAGKLVFDSRVPFSLKLMLPIAAALYWLWPLDLMPGLPFDDIAVLFVALSFFVQLANQAIGKQAAQQSASTAGQGADARPTTNDGVVDTTWRVIE
jgi:uncharacterized membrane protein YkvA (DUF1232 family)